MAKQIFTLSIGISLLLAGSAHAEVPRDQPYESFQQLRAQLAAFKDINHALGQGYVIDPHCAASPAGAMGYHVVNPRILGITSQNPVDGTGIYDGADPPPILLYEKQTDGSYTLVGVELLVFAGAWHGAGYKKAPKYRGRDFDYMEDNPATPRDEAHGFAPHYDLHLWIFERNPSGLYAQWNPNVTCR